MVTKDVPNDRDTAVMTPRHGTTPTTDPGSTAVTRDGAPVAAAPVAAPTVRETVAAQRARFGGVKWGAAFFGWLSANGLAVILVAMVSAAGVAIGLTNGVTTTSEAARQANTLGLAGGIALLVVLFLAYLAGGYVAGRMARFDGVRQGLATWLIGLLVVVVLAAAGAILGAKYNVLQQLNLPRIPVDEGAATTAAIVTLVAVLVVTLLGAVIGGKLGDRYHRRVDRVGYTLTDNTAV